MNLLDYGSGTPDYTQNFWTKMGGVQVLQQLIGTRIEHLIIHAVDPLEIPADTSEVSEGGIDFHFCQNTHGLPENLDIICALHPNPTVGTYPVCFSDSTRRFHYNRYMPLLMDTISDRLSLGGLVVIQFDNEWQRYHGPLGIERYVDLLKNDAFGADAILEDCPTPKNYPNFLSELYHFEALYMLRKVGKNLQNSPPRL